MKMNNCNHGAIIHFHHCFMLIVVVSCFEFCGIASVKFFVSSCYAYKFLFDRIDGCEQQFQKQL